VEDGAALASNDEPAASKNNTDIVALNNGSFMYFSCHVSTDHFLWSI